MCDVLSISVMTNGRHGHPSLPAPPAPKGAGHGKRDIDTSDAESVLNRKQACWKNQESFKHLQSWLVRSNTSWKIFEHLWSWCLLTRFVYTWCLPSSTKGGRGWCSCRLIHHSKAQRHTNEIKTCTANCATLKSHTYRINQGSYMQLFQQRKRSLRMQIPWCSWSMAMALACRALQSGAWPPPVTPYSKVSVKTMDVAVWLNNQIIWQ